MNREKNQDRKERWKNYADLFSYMVLGLLLAVGLLLSWFRMVSFSPSFYRFSVEVALTAVLCETLCLVFLESVGRTYKMTFLLPVAAAILSGFIFGWERVLAGMKDYLNVMVACWNEEYSDNLSYLGGMAQTQNNLSLFCLFVLLLCIAVNGYLLIRKKLLLLFVLVIVYFAPGIILEQSSARGSICLILSVVGLWLFFLQTGSRMRRIMWFLAVWAGLLVIYFTAPPGKSERVRFFEQEIWQRMGQFRYGKDTLPEGNLLRACEMEKGTKVTLRVHSDQVKSMYFQGFTGAVYRDGQWKMLKKNIYAGERRGFLKWMNEQGVDPNSQYVAYQQAGGYLMAENPDETGVGENFVSVKNEGANRRYVYTPYSAKKPDGEKIVGRQDSGYVSGKFFGSRAYTFTEYSRDMPGELQRLDSWVYSPITEKQKKYLEAESVYRDFVYEHYLDENRELNAKIEEMFYPDDEKDRAQNESIYEVTQRIRTKLKDSTRYHPIPKENFGGEDPLLQFLEGKQPGNSAFYASAGVLAFRSFGIPARYAEGYYLNEDQKEDESTDRTKDGVALTAQNAHAWVEVYADGMGWIPVDVTPGFYYDTYTLLQLSEMPQKIKKTAALENQGDEAEETLKKGEEDGGKDGENPQKQNNRQDAVWGCVLIVLFLVETVWIVLEIRRICYEYRIYHCMDMPDKDRETEFLFERIWENLWVCGIDMQPGWHKAETQTAIRKLLLDVPDGMYLKINDLMEKYFYGGSPLEADERRLLWSFLIQLRRGRKKNLSLLRRLRLRFLIFGSAA